MNEIQRTAAFDPWTESVPLLSKKVLDRTLKRMEGRGLVVRHEEPAVFPRSVTYSLSPAAHDLLAAGSPLVEWAEKNQDLIAPVRRRNAERRRRRQPTERQHDGQGDEG
ncbi:winged helix-turn-helix transcriptional regulator [Kibdelosporangium philippinense]|uniref:winged helix-turn-helix transcriptional regulator n=1 Tax=Kibdelosporangium philippinense TaxID=211113 RepID=UPI00361B6937